MDNMESMEKTSIDDIITSLYELIQDAWSLPLGQDKCVIERDKVLDKLDEISAALPRELTQAKTILESRGEVLNNAKREAEDIRTKAKEEAMRLVSESEIYRAAKEQERQIIENANQKALEIRRQANVYLDDALTRTEKAIRDAFEQVQDAHAKFNALTSQNTPDEI